MNPTKWPSVVPAPPDEPHGAGVTLSHIQAWAQLAQDEGVPSDAWALFFEDDCNTVPDVSGLDLPSIIRTTLAAASMGRPLRLISRKRKTHPNPHEL